MEKKQIIRLLFLLIIIILFCTIIVMIFGRPKSNNEQENSNNNVNSNNEEIIETLDEDVIIPKKSYLFFGNYIKGEVESLEIYNTLYSFSSNIIPKFYDDLKDANEQQIYKYYERNSSIINKYMQIDNKESFAKFINKLQKLNADKLEIQTMEFVEDTFLKMGNSTDAKISLNYGNNNVIDVYIKVFKKKQKNNRNVVFYSDIN